MTICVAAIYSDVLREILWMTGVTGRNVRRRLFARDEGHGACQLSQTACPLANVRSASDVLQISEFEYVSHIVPNPHICV